MRTAEVIATLSLATDLAIGLPLEHGLQSTLVAMRLAERLRVDPQTATDTYYACLLFYVGCTADAEDAAALFGGDMVTAVLPVMFGSRTQILGGLMRALPAPDRSAPVRALQVARAAAAARQGARATRVAVRGGADAHRAARPAALGAGAVRGVHRALGRQGRAERARRRGDPALRADRARRPRRDVPPDGRRGRRRRGRDPRAGREAHSTPASSPRSPTERGRSSRTTRASAWDAMLAANRAGSSPSPRTAIDRALAAMGDFADLISPWLAGHSAGVAELAARRGGALRAGGGRWRGAPRWSTTSGASRSTPASGRRPGPLTPDEWEQVRLHPYHSERVLSRSRSSPGSRRWRARTTSASTAPGYHRGASGAAVCLGGRACWPQPTPTTR